MPHETAEYLRDQASRCRGLAKTSLDQRLVTTLQAMAQEYERKAGLINAKQKPVEKPEKH